MKKSELRQIIREEIQKLKENKILDIDGVKFSLPRDSKKLVTKLSRNAKENIKSGRTAKEWIKFMSDEYEVPVSILNQAIKLAK